MKTCEFCEWFQGQSYSGNGTCQIEPPVFPTTGYDAKQPEISKGGKCKKWEPKWDDNPAIKEAWKEFLVFYKLALTEDDDG